MKFWGIIIILACISCSKKFDLVNSSFHDEQLELRDEQTLTYHFAKDNYSILLTDHLQIPLTHYTIEEGSYKLGEKTVILQPFTRIFCRVYDVVSQISCTEIGSFNEPFYVLRDTLSKEEITKWGFEDRVLRILRDNGEMVMFDQIDSFKMDYQRK